MSAEADSQHSEGEQETAQRRDKLLHRLLHTPPQPRPKRERDQSVTRKGKKAKKPPAK